MTEGVKRRVGLQPTKEARDAYASFVARQARMVFNAPMRRKQELKASTALCWPGGAQFGGFHRALQV